MLKICPWNEYKGWMHHVENKAFSLHSSQVCSLLWMTRGDDAGWLDTKYIVMVSHTTACEDKLNNTYLLTLSKVGSFPSVRIGGSGIFADLVGMAGASSVLLRCWVSARKTLTRPSGLGVSVSEVGVSWLLSNALSRSISALATARSSAKLSGFSLEGPAGRRGAIMRVLLGDFLFWGSWL